MKAKLWHIQDSQGQILAHTRQLRPDSRTYETVKARWWWVFPANGTLLRGADDAKQVVVLVHEIGVEGFKV